MKRFDPDSRKVTKARFLSSEFPTSSETRNRAPPAKTDDASIIE